MSNCKTLLCYAVQVLLCLVLVEGLSHLYLLHTKNSLYRVQRVTSTDTALGWKNRPQLNTQFEHLSVSTDQHGFRTAQYSQDSIDLSRVELLTLGPSSAFGWGVPAESTYHELVALSLKVPAANASQLGYSSVQGKLLWEQLKPKVISEESKSAQRFALVGYGVNDLSQFRFYGSSGVSDMEYFVHFPVFLNKFEHTWKWDSFSVFSLIAKEISYKMDCRDLESIAQRVQMQDTIANLSQLMDELIAAGIQPILINTPYYVPSTDAVESDSVIAIAYEQVESFAKEGQCSKAVAQLQKAKAIEPRRIARDVVILNHKLKELAEQKSIPFVDAHGMLSTGPQHLNYSDRAYPSVRGHDIIARNITQTILELKRLAFQSNASRRSL